MEWQRQWSGHEVVEAARPPRQQGWPPRKRMTPARAPIGRRRPLMRYLALYLVALALGAPGAATVGAPLVGALHGQAAAASYLFVPGDIIDITVSSHAGYD